MILLWLSPGRVEVKGGMHPYPAFYLGARDSNGVLTLAHRALTPLSHLPSSWDSEF